MDSVKVDRQYHIEYGIAAAGATIALTLLAGKLLKDNALYYWKSGVPVGLVAGAATTLLFPSKKEVTVESGQETPPNSPPPADPNEISTNPPPPTEEELSVQRRVEEMEAYQVFSTGYGRHPAGEWASSLKLLRSRLCEDVMTKSGDEAVRILTDWPVEYRGPKAAFVSDFIQFMTEGAEFQQEQEPEATIVSSERELHQELLQSAPTNHTRVRTEGVDYIAAPRFEDPEMVFATLTGMCELPGSTLESFLRCERNDKFEETVVAIARHDGVNAAAIHTLIQGEEYALLETVWNVGNKQDLWYFLASAPGVWVPQNQEPVGTYNLLPVHIMARHGAITRIQYGMAVNGAFRVSPDGNRVEVEVGLIGDNYNVSPEGYEGYTPFYAACIGFCRETADERVLNALSQHGFDPAQSFDPHALESEELNDIVDRLLPDAEWKAEADPHVDTWKPIEFNLLDDVDWNE